MRIRLIVRQRKSFNCRFDYSCRGLVYYDPLISLVKRNLHAHNPSCNSRETPAKARSIMI